MRRSKGSFLLFPVTEEPLEELGLAVGGAGGVVAFILKDNDFGEFSAGFGDLVGRIAIKQEAVACSADAGGVTPPSSNVKRVDAPRATARDSTSV